MKITVLGAGAMGSLFGGLLAELGHVVELLDVNPAHIEAVRKEGLRIQTDTAGLRHVRLDIGRPESAHGKPDCLLVFTKTLYTLKALAAAQAILHPGLLVLTLQNGLGNVEKLERFVPRSQIAVGVTTVPAEMVAPGHVRSHGDGYVHMTMAERRHCDLLNSLALAFDQAGLESKIDPAVEASVWQKVAFNAALNTLCAVANCTVGQVGQSSGARLLAHKIAAEVLAVAAAQGHAVNAALLHETLDHALDHHTSHRPSMLQDLLAGRPTEIDAINGEVLRIAQIAGLQVPHTETMAALVRLRETQVTLN